MKKIILLSVVSIFYFPFLIAQIKYPNLIPYRKGNLWGYCDSNKKVIISPQFDNPAFFKYGGYAIGKNSEGSVVIVTKNKKEGLLSENGKLLMPCEFDKVIYWGDYDYLFVAKKGNEFYKLNLETGKLIDTPFIPIPSQLERIPPSLLESDVLDASFLNITITKNSKNQFTVIRKLYWYPNNQSEIKFDTIQLMALNIKTIYNSDDLFLINRNKKWGIISFGKKMLVPTSFDTITNIWFGKVVAVQKGGNWGLVWPKKSLATPIIYQEVKNNDKGDGFLVKRNNKWGGIARRFKN